MSPFIVTVLWSSAVLLVIGIVFGVILGYFSKVLAVHEDPRIVKIAELLPGANCGVCGFTGCANFAENLVSGKASLNKCKQLENGPAKEISKILGIEIESSHFAKKVAVIRCQGNLDNALQQVYVKDVASCKLATTLKIFSKACLYGCVGYGDCLDVCPFEAITMDKKGLPVVNHSLCTGCGLCVDICPRNVIVLASLEKQVIALCVNKKKGKDVKDACRTGCITCMLCVKKCPKMAIQMEHNLPVIDRNLCDLCGLCVEVCPMKKIQMINEK